ncbi:MAG: oligoendopeptidase F, partial [Planctomycetaceae bacterium]|nr:oligoendopeptidase F [Planctomycetaceae bacterium]
MTAVSTSPSPQTAVLAPLDTNLGPMPEWNLGDLYAAIDAPEVTRDLDAAAAESARLKANYQGKLAAMGGDGAELAKVIKAYEALSDLMGKLGS